MRVSSTLGGQLSPNSGSLFFRDETLHLACLLFRQWNRRELRVVASKKINAHKNGRHLSRQKIFFFPLFTSHKLQKAKSGVKGNFSARLSDKVFLLSILEYYLLFTFSKVAFTCRLEETQCPPNRHYVHWAQLVLGLHLQIQTQNQRSRCQKRQ